MCQSPHRAHIPTELSKSWPRHIKILGEPAEIYYSPCEIAVSRSKNGDFTRGIAKNGDFNP